MAFDVIQADVIAHLRGNQWLVQNGHIPKAHAVLCDPPYGLAFMGKEWDTLGAVDFQAWVTEWATLLLDYVYPGALLMAFGGTRTYHRLAAGLEDAGWEIGDSMAWVYAQGFPKSAALDKLLDREAGATREVVGNVRAGFGKRNGVTDADGGIFLNSLPEELKQVSVTAPATPLAARWQGYGTALKPGWESVVVCRAPRGNRTYAALAREFGTGALAIDAGRIGVGNEITARPPLSTNKHEGWQRPWNNDDEARASVEIRREYAHDMRQNAGRWPANFGLVCACEGDDHADDCPVKVLGRQTSERTSKATGAGKTAGKSQFFGLNGHSISSIDDNGGSAARFFYQAKASAWEREAGLHDRARRRVSTSRPNSPDATGKFPDHDSRDRLNVHPTVKPIRLAEYLARLILPPVLDEPRRLLIPFAGSGSEMVGALLAGWDIVTGIERESEYAELARARVGWWAQFSTYDEARKAYEQGRKGKTIERNTKPAFSTAGPLLRCPEHGGAIPSGGNVYTCGCPKIWPGKRKPAPVVVDADDTPTQYALFDERTG